MPIASPIGFLDVTNATLRSSQVEATSRLTVANTAATMNFSVGTKFHIDATSVDPVIVSGNVVATGIKIGNLAINPTFDLGAVSNVGNTTSNIIQFANAATGFVTSSNIEIGGNISFTSNTQVKVDSNVVAEYTGPHGREPKEMPLKKYPEISFDASKLDGNDSTNTYTQAGYTVTASTQYAVSYAAYHTFNDVLQDIEAGAAGVLWTSAVSTYPASGGFYVGTTNGIGTTYGEFVKLELPYKIKPKEVRIFPRTYQGGGAGNAQSPAQFKIFGSNDNFSSEIVELYHQNTDWVNNGTWGVFDISHTTHFKHFGIVFTKTNGSTIVGVQEIEYYGREEPAPPGDSSLDTTLKSTFNSVRSNNYVMYFDGKDPASGNVPKYLVSGSAKSITPNNVVFDATNNCWTLNGSTQSNVTTGSLGFEGDAPHTVSTWINASNLDANTLTQQLFSIGSGYDKALVRVDDTQISANTWHNVTYAYQGEGGSKVTYVDGRKVADEKVTDTFADYPPFAMTGYSQGGYVASASSLYAANFHPYLAFDNNTNPDDPYRWVCADTKYNTNGSYNGSESHTDVDGNVEQGEWIKIKMPHKLKAGYFGITPYPTNGSQSWRNYAILGSNDDINWYQIQKVSGLAAGNGLTAGSVVPTGTYKNSAFKYFVFIWSSKNADANRHVAMGEIKFYGHKEGDLTRFPEPTRVLAYPHILTKNGTGDGYTSPTSAPEYSKRGYVIKASSSIGSYPPYAAFNGETHIATGTVWVGGYNSYGTGAGGSGAGGYKTSGAMNLKTNLGTGGSATSNGEWLYIEMPHKIKVTSTKVVSYDTAPATGHPPDYLIIYGTNDPSSSGGWVVVDDTYASSSSGIPNNATGKTWAVSTASSPVAYKYFAYVLVKVNSSAALSHAIVNDWQLIGTQENTGTPLIVGGPFAGKVANFRVYDQYLGDERIQEIYDAQKDAFGHKKSSMTFYKGRVGVGTTEPEGALTVVDEPNAVAKFPSSNLSADYSFIEGEGCIKISSAGSSGSSGSSGGGGYGGGGGGGGGGGSSGSGFSAFDGLTSTCWSSTPTRNTRVSEEVDFGAWLKMETPESMSLKKAEIDSKPDWNQVGDGIDGPDSGGQLGRAVACNHDGTRIIVGGRTFNSSQGKVIVYDWNGTTWTQVGNILTGPATGNNFGQNVAISGDGTIIAVAAPYENGGAGSQSGTVRVFYLAGATWTVLPDSGALTSVASGLVDVFVGESASDRMGLGGVKLSYDGKTIVMGEFGDDTGFADAGRVQVYTHANGAWSQKGSNLVGGAANERFGGRISMSEDGNHLIIATDEDPHPYVKVYQWNGSAWAQKGSTLNFVGDEGWQAVDISNDGNVVAIGHKTADVADGALNDGNGVVRVYHYESSAWVLKATLNDVEATDDAFGAMVAMSGDGKRLIVSAPLEGTNQGQLFTFEYTGTSWLLRQPYAIIGAYGTSGGDSQLGYGDAEAFGLAISRDGSTIVGGEWGYNGSAGSDSGRARVWNMPSNIKSIWGSNDDVNWTKIVSGPTREEATSNVAGLAFGHDDSLEFKNLDNPNYYKYHAIVADAFTQLKEVKLYGIRKQGSSTLHDGTLTITKKVTAPQLESTGIINMKGDYTEIRANSNVVTCFDRSKKLIKYPRVALTGYSQDGYVVTDSDAHYGTAGWKAFAPFDNGVLYWAAGFGIYSTTSGAAGGVYNTSHASAKRLSPTTDYGEYLILELPHKIIMSSVYISARQSHVFKAPGNFKIYGSNNNSDWYTLLTVTGATPSYAVGNYYQLESGATPYKYLAIVVSKASGGSAFVPGDNSPSTIDAMMIGEISYFGTPETDPEAHGVDVTIKSIPNVPNTDWLEVYYDGQDYTQMPTTVTDKSGNNHTGTPSAGGVGFDSTYKAFTFNKTDNQYLSTSTPMSGNYLHSFSLWFKPNSLTAGSGDALFFVGANGTNTKIELFVESDRINYTFGGNNFQIYPTIVNGKWYHLAGTYNGLGGQNGREIYLDNVKLIGTHSGSTGVLAISTNNLDIGRYTPDGSATTSAFDGSIANFRIFNRALTSDEIYQLYAYQKEYFGHGVLGMTLKNGRLGIGTSQPRGALDVRGETPFIGPGLVIHQAASGNWGTEGDPANMNGLLLTLAGETGLTTGSGYWNIAAQAVGNGSLLFSHRGKNSAYIQSSNSNNPLDFTGQHRTFIKDVPFSQAGDLEGLIVSSDQNKYIKISGGIETGSNAIMINESLPVVSLSNVVTDKKCFGVISASEDPEQRSDAYGSFITPFDKEKGDTRIYINSVGEGAIWVTNINGSLESGDYITTSNVVGYGQKQEGAGLMNYTVAKITMDCDFNPATQPIQIIKKDETGENVLDEHDQIQWEDHPTETEKAYKIRYLDASGVGTDEANHVHKAAFVGCTYHCG